MGIDIDLTLVCGGPDTEKEIMEGEPLYGDGKMTPSFQKAQEIAVKHGGGWADWEPYRCTYEFPDPKSALDFVKEVWQAIGLKAVKFDKDQVLSVKAEYSRQMRANS